jgi:hypothetical protein
MALPQRSLLQIVQAVQSELGLPTDTVVVSSLNVTTQQMYAYANQEIEELFRVYDWTALQTEFNLVVNPPTTVTGTITLNSPVITSVSSTAGIVAWNFQVAGLSIPVAARVTAVNAGASTITMDMEATGTTSQTTITFSQDTYPEPADFDRFINKTWWDRTNHWSLLGPDSPQMDQWHRSGIVAFGPRRHWRQIGNPAAVNNYRLWPPPSEIINPLQLVFEYVSNNAVSVAGSTSTFSPLFANDTDIPVLNDRAIIMGIKWRFWEQKGFDWTSKRTDYDRFVQRLIARDGGRKSLMLASKPASILINSYQVQDGFWPGPTGPNTG